MFFEGIAISAIVLGGACGIKAIDNARQREINFLESQKAIASCSLRIENRKNKSSGIIETTLLYEKPVRLFHWRENYIPVLRIEKDKNDNWSATPLNYKK